MARRKKKQKQQPNRYRWLFWILLLIVVGVIIYEWRTRRPALDPSGAVSRTTEEVEKVRERWGRSDDELIGPPPPENSADAVAPTDGPPFANNFLGYDFTKAPGFGYPQPIPGQQVLRYAAFTLSYDEVHEQAAWVAYELTAAEVSGQYQRPNSFRQDRRVRTGTATTDDYRNSGYDRGHLAPAADMQWSEAAMRESFYLTNVSPQEPGFNRGIWKELEAQVREWAARDGALYVVTGPVLVGKLPRIGESRVSVPEYFYKVILDARAPEIKAIAFLMENKASDAPLEEYVVSIDRLESFTGLDFFPLLPDALEQPLERSASLRGWFTTSERRPSASQ